MSTDDNEDDVPVEALNRRIHTIARMFPLRQRVRAGLEKSSLNPEERVKEFVLVLWRWSGRPIRGGAGRELKAWERIKKSNKLPKDLLRGLCNMYLGLRPELLTAKSFDEFVELVRPRWDGYEAFKLTANFYETSRPLLQAQMHAYYSGYTSNPELAVITAPGWVPDKPILITGSLGSEPVFRFETGYTKTNSTFPTIPGLEEPLHEVRRCVNPDTDMRNGATYRPLEVQAGEDGLRFVFGPGRYFDYHDTCEILGIELAGWMRANPGRAPCAEDLPLRKKVGNIFDLRNRCAVLGVSTLLIGVDRNGRGRYFWHKRDEEGVAVNPGSSSVVPSGTFQPLSDNFGSYPEDFSINVTIMREFAEELLGLKDFTEAGMDAASIKDEAKLMPFLNQLNDGRATIHFLGIGIDPVTTVPEVMTAMVFREDLLTNQVVKNFRPNFEGKFGKATLSAEALWTFSTLPEVHSASSACARLAFEHYDQLISSVRSSRAA